MSSAPLIDDGITHRSLSVTYRMGAQEKATIKFASNWHSTASSPTSRLSHHGVSPVSAIYVYRRAE